MSAYIEIAKLSPVLKLYFSLWGDTIEELILLEPVVTKCTVGLSIVDITFLLNLTFL